MFKIMFILGFCGRFQIRVFENALPKIFGYNYILHQNDLKTFENYLIFGADNYACHLLRTYFPGPLPRIIQFSLQVWISIISILGKTLL